MRREKNLSTPVHTLLAVAEWGDILPSCFNAHATNEYPFWSLFSDGFAIFLCFLLVTVLFKIARSVEVLRGVPELKKVMMCLVEKIHVIRLASFRPDLEHC